MKLVLNRMAPSKFERVGFRYGTRCIPTRTKQRSGVGLFPPRLTFFKDFTASSGLDADFAMGSGKATFTASRSATTPATYVDSNGVIQLTTTSNVPRFQGGFYNATGFHPIDTNGKLARGLMIEGASTNRCLYSYDFTQANWAKVNVSADNDSVVCPDGSTQTTVTLTSSAINGTVLQAFVVASATRTFSIWLKRKTGTGNIDITYNGVNYTTVTLSTDWRRFQVSGALLNPSCGIRITTSGDAIYAWGTQFEDSPYATSFIPTTTAALTRNAEVLKYNILNNRTAAQESIFVKFALNGALTAGVVRFLDATDTKDRRIAFTAIPDIRTRANNTDSSGSNTVDAVEMAINTSFVYGAVYKHTSPYAAAFRNGIASGTNETVDDWINPNWGTFFYIGSSNVPDSQLSGIIQSIAIFNRALSAGEVAQVTQLLNN